MRCPGGVVERDGPVRRTSPGVAAGNDAWVDRHRRVGRDAGRFGHPARVGPAAARARPRVGTRRRAAHAEDDLVDLEEVGTRGSECGIEGSR